jgi:alpha-beta hydrolase superfamily lysophospholipase
MVILTVKSNCKAVTFASGSYLLQGYLHLPQAACPPVVIGVHGLFSNCDSQKQYELADACVRSGIAYFRFDHRGCGGSQGSFRKVTSLGNRHSDLMSAVKLIQHHEKTGDQIGLFGSSFGGTVCISVAADEKIHALVTYASPLRSQPLIEQLEQAGELTSSDAAFYRQNLWFDILSQARKVENIMVIHGDEDEIVPVSHAKEIYRNAGKNKKLIIQPGGDHRMSAPQHQKQFLKDAMQWYQAGFNMTPG